MSSNSNKFKWTNQVKQVQNDEKSKQEPAGFPDWQTGIQAD
jgi:hypothetical protein